jgi:hypothetical protein
MSEIDLYPERAPRDEPGRDANFKMIDKEDEVAYLVQPVHAGKQAYSSDCPLQCNECPNDAPGCNECTQKCVAGYN